jgi:hypothetical protein
MNPFTRLLRTLGERVIALIGERVPPLVLGAILLALIVVGVVTNDDGQRQIIW